jgi:hypothetical protein
MNNQGNIMTEWSHLPNAAHIDQVLTYVELFPIRPMPARDATRDVVWAAARNVALSAVFDAARDVALSAAWNAALGTAKDTAKDVARYVARDGVSNMVWDAILALVAHDHCDRYLTMTSDQLKIWGALSTDPASVLLLPYVTFLGHIKTKETS